MGKLQADEVGSHGFTKGRVCGGQSGMIPGDGVKSWAALAALAALAAFTAECESCAALAALATLAATTKGMVAYLRELLVVVGVVVWRESWVLNEEGRVVGSRLRG